MKSNNLTNDKVEKDVKSNNPVSVNKANSIKFSCYRSLLIAARRMHKYLVNKPFDSIAQINAYLML
ncbi:hypothetical protein [Borrelia miyamotoi]|uniref:hypothetical protein n=1 Tax=Borrelia miyamotoi TaxID=47466 RepID=UPI0022B580E7|nr:hypothetical protein [Borrelia miyamotoi]WAZ93068.1 hypothetical protein O5402_06460 [Borrelia miyamotoi]